MSFTPRHCKEERLKQGRHYYDHKLETNAFIEAFSGKIKSVVSHMIIMELADRWSQSSEMYLLNTRKSGSSYESRIP